MSSKKRLRIYFFKNRILQMKKALEGFINRLDQAEKRIRNSKTVHFEIIQSEKQYEKGWRKPKGFMGHHWSNQYSIIIVSKGEEKEAESLFKEMMAQNFPNLGKEMASRFKNSNEHITIKLSKVKQNFESSRKEATYHVKMIFNKIISIILSTEILAARR